MFGVSVMAVFLPFMGGPAFGDPVGTAFTYQGQLKEAGSPVNATCSFAFGLWGAPAGGDLLRTLSVPGVDVVNGLFTVDLDFGSSPFEGKARWLEIAVCCLGPGDPTDLCARPPTNYRLLDPRQELTPVPYALHAAAGGDPSLWRLNGTSVYYNGGNVGIGDNTPDYKLEVVSGGDGFLVGNANSWFDVFTGGNTRLSLGDGSGFEAGLIMGTENASGENVLKIAGCDDAGNCPHSTTFHENGNVGIGTDDPLQELTVVGDIWLDGADNILIGDTGGFGYGMSIRQTRVTPLFNYRNGEIAYDGDALRLLASSRFFTIPPTPISDKAGITILNGGKVGVGTPTPEARMEIESNSSTSTPQLLLTEDAQDYARLSLRNTQTARFWSIAGATEDAPPDGFPSDNLNFFHSVAGNVLNISYDGTVGHVGIGTTAPEVKLHIRGGTDTALDGGGYAVFGWTGGANISIDSNEIMARNNGQPATLFLNNDGGLVRVPILEITGADLAERFPVTDDVKPGIVVEIDPNHPGQLRMARGAYNRRVAGVVSGANGLSVGAVLGNLPGSEDAPAIALAGRVWVYCDASDGGIEPGDLLTTSETPGHAMKVVDFPKAQGAVLGKAMTALNDSTGLVLVLVSLQ